MIEEASLSRSFSGWGETLLSADGTSQSNLLREEPSTNPTEAFLMAAEERAEKLVMELTLRREREVR